VVADQKLAIISGPTASGKSLLAIEVVNMLSARGISAEIVSADSAQVYRGMDIGTDKLPEEDWQGIGHHLIDVVDPDQDFNAVDFRDQAVRIIARLHKAGKVALVVGGTGFYLRALLQGLFPGPAKDPALREGLKKQADQKGPEFLHERVRQIDPESASRIHPHDTRRLIRALEVYELTGRPLSEHFREHEKACPYLVLMIGLDLERNELYHRINTRVDEMMKKGFLQEVMGLRGRGFGPELKSQQILGYRQLHLHLDGKLDLDQAVFDTKQKTRHYARRQLIWMRAQKETRWLHPERDRGKVIREVLNFFET
jgi:tRNA dimethylallyltransferase